MKFLAILYAVSLTASATALPTDIVGNGPSNIPSLVEFTGVTPPLIKGQKPYVTQATKRTVLESPRSKMNKRATLVVDIWAEIKKDGRHEGLYSETQRCYNLGNGWNDNISSLSVPSGFGCIFYGSNDCNTKDDQITIADFYVADLGLNYYFNDKISSYLCYD